MVDIIISTGIPLLNEVINTFLVNAESITVSAIAIAIYAIIIWHYYRLLARRDFFHFQTDKGTGVWAWFLNFMEELQFLVKYIIFYPIFSFIFFGIFSVMLFLLSKEQSVSIILLTSVTMISATRITAYYNENLARDLAKLVPLALLGVFIVQADFFSPNLLFERVLALPNFFIEIASYILYFLGLEIGLRLLYGLKVLIFNSNAPSRRDKIMLEKKMKELEAKKEKEEIYRIAEERAKSQ